MFFAPKWKHNSKIYNTEYSSWKDARRRCTVKEDKEYPQYGGRGIRMCEQWLDDFDQFIYDMGFKPLPGLTIERLDVNGNYEPENCVWATRKDQTRNRRNTIRVGGKLLVDIADETGVLINTLYQRLEKGLPLDYEKPKAQHGTTNMYKRYKCRCDLCKKAKATVKRQYREKARLTK